MYEDAVYLVFMNKDFATWVQDKMDEKGWQQADLIRATKARGYKINSAQLSRILTRETAAGIDYVIAVAAGLEVSREEAFRARGWLLREPETSIPPGTDPRLIRIAEEASEFPREVRERLLDAFESVIATARATDPLDEVVQEWFAEYQADEAEGRRLLNNVLDHLMREDYEYYRNFVKGLAGYLTRNQAPPQHEPNQTGHGAP